jgi:hypothetical protein
MWSTVIVIQVQKRKVKFTPEQALKAVRGREEVLLQGGSNMTGTNCDLFTHK